jgi:hypothetical protein
MPFYVGNTNASNFQHLHDFEAAPLNHWIPHHGFFSSFYFGRLNKGMISVSEKYASFKKNNGPPHYSIAATYDALEHNEYLQQHQIPLEAVIHPVAQARLASGHAHPHAHHDDHHVAHAH